MRPSSPAIQHTKDADYENIGQENGHHHPGKGAAAKEKKRSRSLVFSQPAFWVYLTLANTCKPTRTNLAPLRCGHNDFALLIAGAAIPAIEPTTVLLASGHWL